MEVVVAYFLGVQFFVQSLKFVLNVVSSHFRYFSLINLKSGQAIYVKPNVGFCCIVTASCFSGFVVLWLKCFQ